MSLFNSCLPIFKLDSKIMCNVILLCCICTLKFPLNLSRPCLESTVTFDKVSVLYKYYFIFKKCIKALVKTYITKYAHSWYDLYNLIQLALED